MAAAEQALELARQAFGPRHPNTLTSLNNPALLYSAQDRYGEAEPLYREALQGHPRPSARARKGSTWTAAS